MSEVITIEGNTNQAASRTGGQVARLRRRVGHHDSSGYLVGFGRPAYPNGAAIEKLLDAHRRELGTTERATNRTEYGAEYGMDGEPWCDIYQSVMGHRVFGSWSPIGKFAYTPSHASWFKAAGRWHEAPAVGDLGFVYYPSMGRIGHVVIVESVVGGAAAGGSSSPRPNVKRRHHTSVLRNGSHGSDVVDAQILLNGAGASPRLVTDGRFGAKTEKETRDFQGHHRLGADGIIGRKTWPVLEREGA